MVSYFKNQWFHLLVACVCFGTAIAFSCKPMPDLTTVEGLAEASKTCTTIFTWVVSGAVWFIMSLISHNEDCIQKLHERITALEKANSK